MILLHLGFKIVLLLLLTNVTSGWILIDPVQVQLSTPYWLSTRQDCCSRTATATTTLHTRRRRRRRLTRCYSMTHEKPMPTLPLPEPICSTTLGTWAHDTMSRRIDGEILERTWLDNRDTWWSTPAWSTILQRFQQLRHELQNAATTPLTHLDEASAMAPDDTEWQQWHDILEPHVRQKDTWLTAPWMITEFYVYRRLMQVLDYWNPQSLGYHYDPFAKPKLAGLQSSVGSAEVMLTKISNLPSSKAGLKIVVDIALWGNKMDLSLWPADAAHATVDVFSHILSKASENVLHDDSDALADYCMKLRSMDGGGNVDIIVDNAGFELVTDLALAQHLIESGIAQIVTFQLKSHPTFVSDAMEKDLLETVNYYETLDTSKFPHSQAAGARWRTLLDQGKWICRENSFWVQPYAMWDMPEPLRSDLASRCHLAIVKGDANYRRLLGDRTWDLTAPFEQVVGSYFPCPVCALRTLKAELGCGMDPTQVARASQLDTHWLVNGRFGVIQLGKGAGRATLSTAE